jgi:hypothetical protein
LAPSEKSVENRSVSDYEARMRWDRRGWLC